MRVLDGRGAGMACLLSAVTLMRQDTPKGRGPSHQTWFAQIRAVDEAAVTIGMRIDDRWIARDDVGGEPPGGGTNAEAVAAETGGDVQARQLVDGRDHRDPVGREVDQPAVLVHDL